MFKNIVRLFLLSEILLYIQKNKIYSKIGFKKRNIFVKLIQHSLRLESLTKNNMLIINPE